MLSQLLSNPTTCMTEDVSDGPTPSDAPCEAPTVEGRSVVWVWRGEGSTEGGRAEGRTEACLLDGRTSSAEKNSQESGWCLLLHLKMIDKLIMQVRPPLHLQLQSTSTPPPSRTSPHPPPPSTFLL